MIACVRLVLLCSVLARWLRLYSLLLITPSALRLRLLLNTTRLWAKLTSWKLIFLRYRRVVTRSKLCCGRSWKRSRSSLRRRKSRLVCLEKPQFSCKCGHLGCFWRQNRPIRSKTRSNRSSTRLRARFCG